MNETAISTDTTQPLVRPLPTINSITLDHPWRWIAAGWRDLTQAPEYSLTYGVVFVVISFLLTMGLFSQNMFFLVPPLAAGYFLVAPMLGVSLYQVSRNLEEQQPIQFCQALEAWNSNRFHLSAFSVVLLLILIGWLIIAKLVFALFFTGPLPNWPNFIPEVFLSGNHMVFVIAGVLSGGVIAAFTYAISAISVPLLMDRQIDVVSAMQTSFQAVLKNWQPMLLWGALIVMFVGIGIVTFYAGLLVAMPLVGHATWHAYRDIVAQD